MLVKICDICGTKIDVDDYVKIEGGFIKRKEKSYCNRDEEFYECDICMSCAKTYSLMQIIDKIIL